MTGPLSPLRLTAMVALLLVSGCSKDHSAATNAPVAPAYAAVARGSIEIEGGLLSIQAPREGTLASVRVHEGDHVARGETLATMQTQPATLEVEAAKAGLAQARAESSLLTGKLGVTKQQAARLSAAAKAGAGDDQSADLARGAVNELEARKAAADAAVDMARQKLDGARYELGLLTLRAPIDARVVRMFAQAGAQVSPQSGPLFTLLPRTPPTVRAELSESMVDAVKVGMAATVSTDGSGSDSSWPAHVVRLGSVVGPSTLQDDSQQRLNARTVSCVLSFDQPQDLRIGQRVLVRFGSPSPPTTATKAR
ncbi:MAG: HlyD family efflux transporter periplasmic adaptor subunit [Pseudomonadota bacterium]|nr:HlyD family efflux transporter periplasmic adaptor subunit [Pseudomonadota bacterium]